MIINVRGTHGSGKSTLVRKVLAQYRKRKPVFVDGRRLPVGYVCDKRLFVPGHYEGDIGGGCDNITTTDLMYKMIRRYAKRGMDVLFEGILAQHSVPRVLELRDAGYKIRVIVLEIPVKQSIRSVKRRRKKRGDKRKLDPTNLIREARAVQNASRRLKDAGIRVTEHSTRKAARKQLFGLLELS